jgi:Na+-transporting methylmalonyl-CoA/oxaloacetate decarboxylase gamma subunit
MKKRLIKVLFALALVFTFGLFIAQATNVYAAEVEPTTTTEVEEETTTTEVATTEKTPLESAIDYIKSLSKDDLIKLKDQVTTILGVSAVTTVITFLSLIIGLVAAIVKLRNATAESKENKEAQELETRDLLTEQNEYVTKNIDALREMVTAMFNNLTEEQKEQVRANTEEIKKELDAITKRNEE